MPVGALVLAMVAGALSLPRFKEGPILIVGIGIMYLAVNLAFFIGIPAFGLMAARLPAIALTAVVGLLLGCVLRSRKIPASPAASVE